MMNIENTTGTCEVYIEVIQGSSNVGVGVVKTLLERNTRLPVGWNMRVAVPLFKGTDISRAVVCIRVCNY